MGANVCAATSILLTSAAAATAAAKESASKPFSICQQNATSIMLLWLQIIQITVQYYTREMCVCGYMNEWRNEWMNV